MSAKYSVRFEEVDTFVPACDLDGFFVGHHSDDDFGTLFETENARITFRLVHPTVEVPFEALGGDIEVLILDTEGQPMGRYPLWNAKLIAGDASEFLTIKARTGLLPHTEARRLWDRFRNFEPQRGEWCAIPVGAREAWLEVAGLRYAESAPEGEHSTPPREIVMDGSEIKDVASFFCAIGEAFRGPGGYLGQSFTELDESLDDHLRGASVRLIWRDMPVARSALSAVMDIAGGPISKFDLILEILSQNSVDVRPG